MKCNFVTFPQVLSYFKIKNFYKTCMLQNSFFQGLKYSDVFSQIKLIWITVASFLLPLVLATLGPRSCGACLRLRHGLFGCCVLSLHAGSWAPGPPQVQLWGPVAPRHVRSSRVRTRTRVSCPGRCILCHRTTEEALSFLRKLLGPHCRAVAPCLVADFPVTCPWVGGRSQREGPTPGPGPGPGPGWPGRRSPELWAQGANWGPQTAPLPGYQGRTWHQHLLQNLSPSGIVYTPSGVCGCLS